MQSRTIRSWTCPLPSFRMKFRKCSCRPQERVSERIVARTVDFPLPQIPRQMVKVVKIIPQERVSERVVDLAVLQTCECRPCPPSCTAPAECFAEILGVLQSTVVELVLRPPWYRQNPSFDSTEWSLSVLHAAQTSVLLSVRGQATVHPGRLDVPGLL